MNLLTMKVQLIHWMNDMKHGYRDSSMYMEIKDKGRIRIVMYTQTNVYYITAVCNENIEGVDGGYIKREESYLGAQANSRTPRAGENWTRGNDLADGEFSKETWIRILSDIVGYELVKIHRSIGHKSDCINHNTPLGKCDCRFSRREYQHTDLLSEPPSFKTDVEKVE